MRPCPMQRQSLIACTASLRLIFWGEGLITMGLGIIGFFLLPDGPEQAKFLSPEERGKPMATL